MTKYLHGLPVAHPGQAHGVKHATARLARAMARRLFRLARALSAATHRLPAADPVLEFYAEAGAPEGALYVNGELVGRLDGVQRL